MNNIVPEIDVLIASAIWLWKQRKVIPLQFSLAKGKGINLKSDEKRLRDELKAAGVPDTSNIRKEVRISSPSQFLLSRRLSASITSLIISARSRISSPVGTGFTPTTLGVKDRAVVRAENLLNRKKKTRCWVSGELRAIMTKVLSRLLSWKWKRSRRPGTFSASGTSG